MIIAAPKALLENEIFPVGAQVKPHQMQEEKICDASPRLFARTWHAHGTHIAAFPPSHYEKLRVD